MSWTLRVARRAEKLLARSPAKDRARLVTAIAEMQDNPFVGDVVRLQGEDNTWRRRVGSYRILFEIDIKELTVDVLEVARRTSTTY
jgi:mRNA interferase RelE/StbE